MSYTVRANPVFENDRDRFLKNRPLAKSDIASALKSFAENPHQGDRIPGINVQSVYKARWPLKSYRIGSRGGLRFIFIVQEAEKTVLPITLWQKKEMTNESDVRAHIILRIKQTIEHLRTTG